MTKVWYITGASQGFGLSLVKKLLDGGHRVAATSRNVQVLKNAVDIVDSARFLPLAVDKIAYLAELREAMGLNFRIEVDGGIAHDTVASVVQAGAEMLVAGSAVFARGKTEQNARELLKLARAAAEA